MPLLVDNILIEKQYFKKLTSKYAKLKESCLNFKREAIKTIDSNFTLYVNQREYAIINPNENIEIAGSDDATTCHFVILRHTGSGCVALGHLDGHETKEFLNQMFSNLKKISLTGPDGIFEAHIIGGFIDDKGYSTILTTEILDTLNSYKENIFLNTACVLDDNTVFQNGIYYPIFFGIAITIKTGKVFPATFKNKRPDIDIRSAGLHDPYTSVIKIYSDKVLTIGPFNWNSKIAEYFQYLDDTIILKNLSTSPKQEPSHFCDDMRQMFKILLKHRKPLDTLFKSCQPIRYQLDKQGFWVKLESY